MSYSYDILCSVSDLRKRTSQMQTELDGIERNIKSYESSESLRDYDTTVQGISRLNVTCENFVLETRRMLAMSDVYEPSVVAEFDIANAFDYQIGYTSRNWLVIDVPPLLHKKGERAKTYYIRENLRLIFQKFKSDIPSDLFFRYNNCTVIIESVYEYDKHNSSYYDFDSIELTSAINRIADAFMVDDGAKNIRKFLVSTAGDQYRTRIYVVPNNEFPDFYSMFTNEQIQNAELFSQPHIF